jgi:hypothetical protein
VQLALISSLLAAGNAQSPTTAPTWAPTFMPTDQPTLSPTMMPSVTPTASPTFSPTVSPTMSPTMTEIEDTDDGNSTEIDTSAPTWSPTMSPSAAPEVTTASPTITVGRPSKAPTIAPEPVATLEIPLMNLPTGSALGTYLTNIAAGIKGSLGTATAADDNVEVQVVVEITETGSMGYGTEPSADEQALVADSIKEVRCGGIYCMVTTSVTAVSSRRRRLADAFTLAFTVVLTIDDDTDPAALVAAQPFTDAGFKDAFATKFNTAATAAGVSTALDTSAVDVASSLTTASKATAKIVIKDESQAGTASLTDIQNAAADTTTLLASVASQTGQNSADFGTIVVDLCAGRTCSGRGTCSAGVCTCSASWIGNNCSVAQESPSVSPTSAPSAAPVKATAAPTDVVLNTGTMQRTSSAALLITAACVVVVGMAA